MDPQSLEEATDSMVPLHVRVRNAIARAIDAGRLGPGEQLPPVRTLAEMFGVGLRTASRGVHLLQEEGRVKAVHGRGAFVTPERHPTSSPTLRFFLHPGSLSRTPHADITRFQGVVATAAKRDAVLETAVSLHGYDPSHFVAGSVGIMFSDVHYRRDGFGWAADLAVERKLPCCVLKRGSCEFPAVLDNRHKGFQALVEHLASLGHRRIAMLNGLTDPGHDGTRLFRDNRRGYLTALRGCGLREGRGFYAEVSTLPTGSPVEHDVRDAIERLLGLGRPPTAIACMNDGHALAVLEVLRERGVRVPEDMSLTGFDNTRASETSDPPLTTADGKTHGQGEAAVEYLLARLSGRRVRAPAVMPTLIVRGSTGPPR